jgi:hypothetical protein
MKKAAKKAKPAKKEKVPETPEELQAKAEESEKHDKTRAGSFRRLAKAFSCASVWDNHTIAAMLNSEADVLDPKHSTAPDKDDLEKKTVEAKAVVARAEVTLADPNATPADIDQASKAL